MERFTLEVQERSVVGRKAKHLREKGLTPAVLYGAGEPTLVLQFESRALERMIAEGASSQLISLLGDSVPETRVLIREMQRHPVRRTLQHVDFVRIAKGAKLRTSVPLVMVGTAPVQAAGAMVLQNTNMIEIECLPDDLPVQIEADISGLVDIHKQVVASDLELPRGVELTPEQANEVVISVTISRAAIEAAAEEEEEEDRIRLGAEPSVEPPLVDQEGEGQ